MKCVATLDNKHIKRVTDEEASELFHEGGWRYVAKSVWKEKVRDVEETPNNTPKTIPMMIFQCNGSFFKFIWF